MKIFQILIFIVFSAILMGCNAFVEPIIDEAVEKAVDEYNNSNPLAERVIEVEKIVEVPVEKIETIAPTPTPKVTKLPNEIDQEWDCVPSSEECKIASGQSTSTYDVSPSKIYDINLSFISGYEASELKIDIDLCYPHASPCWQTSGENGFAALIAQPLLNDYTYAEEKWIPSKAILGWDGTIIYTSKVSVRTPTEWFYWTYDPIITITDPEGNISNYNFKNWRAVNTAQYTIE
ncbi:MAG: hypothetical protein CL907_01135 [Dehalococcoidia bacterium]|nr:hypothetical protein [Dehalococcoidia bacterium]